MVDRPKHNPERRAPGGPTDFGDLQEDVAALKQGHVDLNRRFDVMANELKANTAATSRTEEGVNGLRKNTEKLVTAFSAAEGAFTTLDWIYRFGLRVSLIALPGAFLYAGWEGVKAWLKQGGKP